MTYRNKLNHRDRVRLIRRRVAKQLKQGQHTIRVKGTLAYGIMNGVGCVSMVNVTRG